MRNYQKIKEKVEELTIQELREEVISLVKEIIQSADSILSVDKSWVYYGTWKSVGFANKSAFGDELSKLILKGINGHVTHDEEKEFILSDFEDDIFASIFEGI